MKITIKSVIYWLIYINVYIYLCLCVWLYMWLVHQKSTTTTIWIDILAHTFAVDVGQDLNASYFTADSSVIIKYIIYINACIYWYIHIWSIIHKYTLTYSPWTIFYVWHLLLSTILIVVPSPEHIPTRNICWWLMTVYHYIWCIYIYVYTNLCIIDEIYGNRLSSLVQKECSESSKWRKSGLLYVLCPTQENWEKVEVASLMVIILW